MGFAGLGCTGAWELLCVQEGDLQEPQRKDKPRKKRGGGPKTATGKESASRNAITHGLRAKKSLILEGESQEEFEALAAGWRKEFEPEGASGERLIQGVILNDCSCGGPNRGTWKPKWRCRRRIRWSGPRNSTTRWS